jgi:cell division transport system permease protein
MTSRTSTRPGAIIPANIGALRSLTVAMTVMCYLACLAIGALVLTNRAVNSWTSGLSREVTVQVRQMKDVDLDAEVAKAQEILQDFPGVAGVAVLDRDAGARLLEPWLGSQNLEDLPIPRLIKVVIDETAPPDYESLAEALREVKGANLDTHRRWQSELTRMARALSILAYTVLTLIGVSAVAIVVFGTRAVLQAHRPIVDLLHLVGARDGYIARQIDGRFLKTGLFAGLSGMLLGLATFFFLSLTGPRGGGGLADASRSLLFAPPESAGYSYALLLAVPVMATLISLVTSRVTLMRMLGEVL